MKRFIAMLILALMLTMITLLGCANENRYGFSIVITEELVETYEEYLADYRTDMESICTIMIENEIRIIHLQDVEHPGTVKVEVDDVFFYVDESSSDNAETVFEDLAKLFKKIYDGTTLSRIGVHGERNDCVFFIMKQAFRTGFGLAFCSTGEAVINEIVEQGYDVDYIDWIDESWAIISMD